VSKWPESDGSIASLSCLGGLVSKWPDCDLLGEARSSQLCMVDLSLKLERRKDFIRENPFSPHLCATVFSIS
jgi:hypothetical protein